MSDEMAQKKKQELEDFEKTKKEIVKEIMEDRCPACGLETAKLEFFNPTIIQAFGWVECTRCGNVYCPKSIMKQKKTMSAGIDPSPAVSQIIQP